MTEDDNKKLIYSATITVSKDKNNGKKLKQMMDEEEKKNEATEKLWKKGAFEDEKEG